MRKLLNSKGLTMVNVIIAFAILMTGSVLFYKSIQVSLNLIEYADNERKLIEESISDYYTNKDNGTGDIESKDIEFALVNNGALESNIAFSIESKIKQYENSDKSVIFKYFGK